MAENKLTPPGGHNSWIEYAILAEKFKKTYPRWSDLNVEDVHPMPLFSRFADDYGGPLAKAWGMLAVYDFSTGRKYSQPYFALHPK